MDYKWYMLQLTFDQKVNDAFDKSCNCFVIWIRDMFAPKFQIRHFRAALFVCVCVYQDICDISYFNGVWCFAFV